MSKTLCAPPLAQASKQKSASDRLIQALDDTARSPTSNRQHKKLAQIRGFLSPKLVQRSRQKLVQNFVCLVFPHLRCFLGIFNRKQCVGVRKCLQVFGVSKKGTRKIAFCFCLSYVGEKTKKWINGKQKNCVFWVVGNSFFAKVALFKNCKTLFVFGKRKEGHFR